MDSFPLAKYDAMVTAIAECHKLDEVKDIADKAKALDIYFKQAGNTAAERQACDVRLRAERRCGELLRDLERASPRDAAVQGGIAKAAASDGITRQDSPKSPYASAIEEAGITRQKANTMEALAKVPQADFDSALAAPDKPSVSAILTRAKTAPKQKAIDPKALWIWGRLRDFERDNLFDISYENLMSSMTDTMQSDVVRLLPKMQELFNRLVEESHEPA